MNKALVVSLLLVSLLALAVALWAATRVQANPAYQALVIVGGMFSGGFAAMLGAAAAEEKTRRRR